MLFHFYHTEALRHGIAMSDPSVCQFVCQMCELWQNESWRNEGT